MLIDYINKLYDFFFNMVTLFQNVKAVFDAAIKVVLQPPKPKKRRKKGRPCAFL